MPQFDFASFVPQLIWLAITFITLYFVMSRIALPRIANVIEERRDRIANDLDQAEQLKLKTEEAIATYEQALAEARAKAHGIAQEARDKLSAEIEQERSAADKQVAEKTAEAEARIHASSKAALEHVNEVAATTAESIVEAMVGGRVTKSEISAATRKAMST
jgi:F-type H+-transporting ATPase subunit b